MTNSKRKMLIDWLARNKFRLMFAVSLVFVQVLLVNDFGKLLGRRFFYQMPIVIASLIILFGIEIVLFVWLLRAGSRMVRFSISLIVLVAASLLGGCGYRAIEILSILGHTVLVDSKGFGTHTYDLMLIYELETPAYYLLYDCDQLGRACVTGKRVPAEANYPGGNNRLVSPAKPTSLVIFPLAESIGIREGESIIYEYPLPQSYP
jgi:hypothetical protein